MKADQAKFLAETLGQNLQGEWMHTYKAINAVPDGKKDYKPQGDSRSAWDLAQHIAMCDVGFLHAVAANRLQGVSREVRRHHDPGAGGLVQTRVSKSARKGAGARRQSPDADRRGLRR